MFNKKLKERIVELEEENKHLKNNLHHYLIISNIDDELNKLVKERDELETIIKELKEKLKNEYRIVEKDEIVVADRMRIENYLIIFENYISTDDEWIIVATCASELTVIKK